MFKCKIWGTFCENETNLGFDGWRLNSARAGGRYELAGSLAATDKFVKMTDGQKVLMTDYILEENSKGHIAQIHSMTFPDIISRSVKTLQERKQNFLKTIYNRNPIFGKKVNCFGDGPALVAINMDNYTTPSVKIFHDSFNDFLARSSCVDASDMHALAKALSKDEMILPAGPNYTSFELTSEGYTWCETANTNKIMKNHNINTKYDVALSFAGEDRKYVAAVASTLKKHGVETFYDDYEQVSLWGKNLYEHLDQVYKTQSKYVVMFISNHYANKVWTTHERRSAQARAFREKGEYILPVRFDDTEIPGLHETVGYIDLNKVEPSELARMIISKLEIKANNWNDEAKKSSDFANRYLMTAHRGAFLWKEGITAIFDNRNELEQWPEIYEVLIEQLDTRVLGTSKNTILVDQANTRALHDQVWDLMKATFKQPIPVQFETQRSIAECALKDSFKIPANS